MPRRTQITRHDCVEGWSAIGKWTGVPAIDRVARRSGRGRARGTSSFTAPTRWDEPTPESYYESIDMDDALHPQTLLAYELNDAALPIANGAPIRLRVERQLGYKHAKYVMRIELVESFANIARRQGRLLGRQRLPVVRRDLKRWVVLLWSRFHPRWLNRFPWTTVSEWSALIVHRLSSSIAIGLQPKISWALQTQTRQQSRRTEPAPTKSAGAAARQRGCRGRSASAT